jgi:hypothetical protein
MVSHKPAAVFPYIPPLFGMHSEILRSRERLWSEEGNGHEIDGFHEEEVPTGDWIIMLKSLSPSLEYHQHCQSRFLEQTLLVAILTQ